MTLKSLMLLALLLAGCASPAPTQRGDHKHFDHQAATLEDLLETEIPRRFPGVRAYRDVNGVQLRIRGSLQEPLYVVDGVPLSPTPGGVLWGISLYEIENIEVVSDVGRLAKYGMRGAGGAVLITTKQP